MRREYNIRFAFQSTPPGWEATATHFPNPIRDRISIHASRVGGDPMFWNVATIPFHFNPRLPGGRRPCRPGEQVRAQDYFNPRLPGGRRQYLEVQECY